MTEDVAALPRELPDAELVLAFVSPLGTPLDIVQEQLDKALREHGYDIGVLVHISKMLEQMNEAPAGERPGPRQTRLIRAGNDLRREYGGDHLALMAIAHINASRAQDETGQVSPFERRAHVIRSLKHPEEVARLRQVYGKGFFLLGVSAPRKLRRATLIARDFMQSEADALLEQDAGEEEKIGQQTRDTFELADAYLWLDGSDPDGVEQKVRRIVDLLFSCAFHPPSKEEHAMFMAYAAALRSSDLSRQVGAVVTNRSGDVIASGANDVPAPEGATYWPPVEFTGNTSDSAGPDYLRGYDSNERERNKILAGVIAALVPSEASSASEMSPAQRGELVERYRDRLKATGILDLTEFGRAVHAEMAALMSCARSGVTPLEGTLYCTTFPCHNCAKHIIASGITRVVYVEPYPKSKAKDLHADAIFLPHEDDNAPSGPRVVFSAFEGIGPRRFVDLFSLSLGNGRPVRRKLKGADGARVEWKRGEGSLPRLPLDPRSYLEREDAYAKDYRRQQSSSGKLSSPELPPQEDPHGRDQAQHLSADHTDLAGSARRSEASGGSRGEVAGVETEAVTALLAGRQREPKLDE